MYHIPLAGGIAGASGAGALAIPSSASSPVLQGAHQALAFTGFTFGAYVVFGLLLILAGLVLRKASAYTRRVR